MASFYLLRSGCCDEVNIILCEEHLRIRLAAGYKIGQYRGPDNNPCWDCIQLGFTEPTPHKFEGHKPSVVKSSDPQGQGTAATGCCGKHG